MGCSTISFVVEKPQPFPAFAISAVSVGATIVIVAIMLVNVKKRKHRMNLRYDDLRVEGN